MFTQSDAQPEGFNVFYWCDDGAVKGTKMVKLDGNKTINDYGLDKNSVLYLKYRCRVLVCHVHESGLRTLLAEPNKVV